VAREPSECGKQTLSDHVVADLNAGCQGAAVHATCASRYIEIRALVRGMPSRFGELVSKSYNKDRLAVSYEIIEHR